MDTGLERQVRNLKAYVATGTLVCAILILAAFTRPSGQQVFDEIVTTRIRFVDSLGAERARIGAQSGRGSAPGLLFFDSTEGAAPHWCHDRQGYVRRRGVL
jgi:hypothetical protein